MSVFTITGASARTGLPGSTLRYWERVGLVGPVERDDTSGHRRYSEIEVLRLETLANLRAVGMSIDDMRGYTRRIHEGDRAAADQRDLFAAHADRVRGEIAELQLRLGYLELKVAYWSAREAGDGERADEIAQELVGVIRQIIPKERS